MRVYALLVGIGTYQKPSIPRLYGPPKDVSKIQEFLQSRYKPEELKILQLLDSKATKETIVNAFDNHLSLAAENDQVLFYFSGHGALEQTHNALKGVEQKDVSETLVCYDSMAGATTLADKELRYLIKQISAKCPNIVIIQDCCHSGGSTRNVEMILKRLSVNLPARDWNEFVFSKSLSEQQAAGAKKIDDIFPEGPHVQLAACEWEQSAWEVRGAGIFTNSLLMVLNNTQGNINYSDLFSRTKHLMANRFNQFPSWYSYVGKNANGKPGERLFLGGTPVNPSVTNANIIYNSPTQKWILDKGAIQGVRNITGNYELEVKKSTSTPPVTFAAINTILPDHSFLDLKDNTIDKNLTYATVVKGLYQRPLNIALEGDEKGIMAVRIFYNLHAELYRSEGITLTEDFASADYLIFATGNWYSIERPAEFNPEKGANPIVKEVPGYTNDSISLLLTYFISIARWELYRNLKNDSTKIETFPLQLELTFKDSTGITQSLKPGDDNTIRITYPDSSPNGLPKIKSKIRLINNSERTWYCAVILLGIGFDIITKLIPEEVKDIPAKNDLWLNDKQEITFTQEEFTAAFGRSNEVYYLLLIASSVKFDISSISQEALPLPTRNKMRGEEYRSAKGIDLNKPSDKLPSADWSTRLVKIQIDIKKKVMNNVIVRLKALPRDASAKDIMGMEDSDPIVIKKSEYADLHPWDQAHLAFEQDGDITFAEPEVTATKDYYPLTMDMSKVAEVAKGAMAVEDYKKFIDYWPHPEQLSIWHLDDDYSQLKSSREHVKDLPVKKTVRIAHFDTGYDPSHISFPKSLIRTDLQRNFVEGEEDSYLSAVDPFESGILKMPGHGPGTLSILAGTKVAMPHCDFDDYIGLADSVEIVPIRVAKGVVLLKSGAFVKAMNYVLNELHEDESTRIHVITMSMGGVASQAWADVVNEAYEKGIFIVTAAGNNFNKLPTRTLVYPARFNRVVAACGATYKYYPYHKSGKDDSLKIMEGNYGPDALMKTAIAAYAPNVPWATYRYDDIVGIRGDGTSSATPQIAAAAALYYIKHYDELEALPEPWMKVEAIRKAMFSSAKQTIHDDYKGEIFKFFGNGLLQTRLMLEEKVPAVAELKKEDKDKVSFPFFRLILGTRDIEELQAAREEMMETELMQLLLSSPELQKLLGNEEKNIEIMSNEEIIAFIDAVLIDKDASDTLKNNLLIVRNSLK